MNPIPFAIIGGGWRAEFYLRIARALPECFTVTGIYVRDAAKRATLQHTWNIPAADSIGALRRTLQKPRFIVISVPSAVACEYLGACAELKIPALGETPPAPTLGGLLRLHTTLTAKGARVQIAEQYAFQPHHAALLAIAHSGRLGNISQVQASVAHGCHAMHIMRRFLGAGFQNVTVEARARTAPLVEGPGRDGPPARERIVQDEQTFARFDFENGRLGLHDFTYAQYFSWIRANRILVRGERGELDADNARWLLSHDAPISAPIVRHDAGQRTNLEGFYHKGYTLGAEWIYRNPLAPGRLADDEIAIATCLLRMSEYADDGDSFYDLREASQDQYLSLLMDEAVKTGQPAKSVTQPWAK
ncbi:MAG: Gfo/Idh/MocA family oxidoreductase [Opitutaceae bacterium]|jgi:predicted dehydrogenase|nr:Gfo/Idh/MocA family oxidoreductase [Opitutaceae bacterium]